MGRGYYYPHSTQGTEGKVTSTLTEQGIGVVSEMWAQA